MYVRGLLFIGARLKKESFRNYPVTTSSVEKECKEVNTIPSWSHVE
jgi:hypothetical protein